MARQAPAPRPFTQLDRFHWTPKELHYLVNVTGCDIMRLKGGPESELYGTAQKVHAKLKLIAGGQRKGGRITLPRPGAQ